MRRKRLEEVEGGRERQGRGSGMREDREKGRGGHGGVREDREG